MDELIDFDYGKRLKAIEDDIEDIKEKIVQIFELFKVMQQDKPKGVNDWDISAKQFQIIKYLYDNDGEVPMKSLSDEKTGLGIPVSTVSQTVKKLVNKRVLEKTFDNNPQSRYKVKLKYSRLPEYIQKILSEEK